MLPPSDSQEGSAEATWHNVASPRKAIPAEQILRMHESIALLAKKVEDIEQSIDEKKEKQKTKGMIYQQSNTDTASEYHGRPICAFVTFNTHSSRNLALAACKLSTYEWVFPPPVKLFKQSPIVVSPGPEPSTILWENLQYDIWHRYLRRCVSLFFVCIFLAVTIFATFTSRILQQITNRSGGIGICPASWSSMSTRYIQ